MGCVRTKKIGFIGLPAALFCLASMPAQPGSLTVFSQPTAYYTSSTTLIDISGLTEFSNYNSISGGSLTVSFNTPVQRNQVTSSWATWSCPPAGETCTPAVLWTIGASDITLTLSSAESTFGFEAEPDNLTAEAMTAEFFNGTTVVGSITLDPSGNAGALLFAASSTTPFTSVEISNAAADDFAIANVRFSPNALSVPEPGSCLLFGVGLAAIGYFRRRRL